MKTTDKLTKSRAGLVLDDPFFGSLLLRLIMVEDSSIETMGTDGKKIRFNPAFVDSLSMDQLKGVLCHEVMHCALGHMSRRGDRNPIGWNIAADYAVNPIIRNKYSLPGGALFNPDWVNLSVEDIYSKIPKDEKSGQDKGKGKGKGQGQDIDPGGCGAVEDLKNEDGSQASAADKSQSESEWKVAAVQAAQQAKSFGDLPAGIDRIIEEILNPKIDWREVLKRFVDTSAKNDYSLFPPNRRHIHNGLFLPSCKSNEIGSIVIAVDTSGSISQSQLNEFSSELFSIISDFSAEIHVLYCDTKIQKEEFYSSGDLPSSLKARGGGGTDFRPVFNWIEEHGLIPSCLIYFTDLYGSFPEEIPFYPVLWIVNSSEESIPFGELLKI